MMKREEDLESVSMRSIHMRMGSVNGSVAALSSVGNISAVAAAMGSLHGTNSVNISTGNSTQIHTGGRSFATADSPCTVPSNTPMNSVSFR